MTTAADGALPPVTSWLEEREAVVTWLKDVALSASPAQKGVLLGAAARIERGEHVR